MEEPEATTPRPSRAAPFAKGARLKSRTVSYASGSLERSRPTATPPFPTLNDRRSADGHGRFAGNDSPSTGNDPRSDGNDRRRALSPCS